MPLANDLFNSEVIWLTSWSTLYLRIGIGMLFGPVDLETEEMSDMYF